VRIVLRDARELEGVAGMVGGVLHFGTLVVVGEDHDVARGGETPKFLLEVVELGHGGTPGIGSESGGRVYGMEGGGGVRRRLAQRHPAARFVTLCGSIRNG